MDVKEKEINPGTEVASNRFPRVVVFIILTEFCERFSYSGMRAFLALYLRSKLGYSDAGATEVFHAFTALVYLFPILGGVIADNYLGKFKTILYLMFVYAAGNLLVAAAAAPPLQLPARACTLLGLLMITVGTGGIKPCVTSFGGDQFQLPEQQRPLAVYFSVLYFALSVGCLIAKTVSPILRSEVHCFGDKDCYSLAFGAPGLVVLMSVFVFVSARRGYTIKKPGGNVVIDFVKCICLGLKNRLVCRDQEKAAHWLDSTEARFGRPFVQDVRKTLSILCLFSVVPMFWALLDQMGSRWTLQATKMSGRAGWLEVKPDQTQVLGPAIIILLIPLTQKYVYPYLGRRNLLRSPFHRLILGGVLAGVSFMFSAAVEIYIKTTYPELPQPGSCQLRIFNVNPCHIHVTNSEMNISSTIDPMGHFKLNVPVDNTRDFNFEFRGNCLNATSHELRLDEGLAVSYVSIDDELHRCVENVDKSKSGLPVVRVLSSLSAWNVTLYHERGLETELALTAGVSPQREVFAARYGLAVNGARVRRGLQFDSGGVYVLSVVRNGARYSVKTSVVTAANSISMAWLLPQFVIMSAGEVLFGVTGNEFAFKESPASMRAVMAATWLLTEAVGNVIIIVVTRLCGDYAQETQSFLYTGMIFIAMFILYFLSRNYKMEGDTTRKGSYTVVPTEFETN